MAVRTWTGDVSGDWNTTGNWDEGSVPVNGDEVYIVSGSVSIVGFDAADVTLDSLTVGAQYTGSIGTSGGKMQISSTNFDYSGTGTSAYYEVTYTTLTIQNTSTSDDALNLYGDSDTITTLRILGGRGGINIDSSCNITTTIEQIGSDGVTTNIADSTTIGGSCTLAMDSGKLDLNQAIPTITIFGGELVAALDTGTVTTINQYGGRVRWNPTASCTITTLTLYNGLFDSKNSTSPAFTITNATVHEGGLIDERSGLENAVWTNPVAVEGGDIRYDSGRSVTIN